MLLDKISVHKEMVKAYAEASLDFNPIHLDENFARSAGLNSCIAHGMLSLGLSISAVEKAELQLKDISVVDVKFKDKLYVGETLEIYLLERNGPELKISSKVGDREILQLQLKTF